MRALRAKTCCRDNNVSYVLTWSCPKGALRAYVFTYQRALRAYVRTCQYVLRVQMLTYQRALSAYVLTCQRVLRAYVLTCQQVLRTYVFTCQVLTCSCTNMPWVPCLIRSAWLRNHLPAWFASSVSSFEATLFSFTAIDVEVVHTVGKV